MITQLHEKDEALPKLRRKQSETDEIVQHLETESHKMTEALENAAKEGGEKDETITELSAKFGTTEEQRMKYKDEAERLNRKLDAREGKNFS